MKKAAALSQLSGSTSIWLTRRAALISHSHAEQLSMERKRDSFSETHQRRTVDRRLAPGVSASYGIFAAAVGPNIQARELYSASNVLALAGQSLKRKKTSAVRETKEAKSEDSRTTNDSNANNVFRDRWGFGNARAVDFKGARLDPQNALTLSAGSARSREEARTIRSSKATRQLKKMPKEEREKFFSELQKSGNADVYHYSAMLSHAADSAQTDSLLEQMAEAGVRPNIVTYNTLINKHQDSGQFDRANALLDSMRASGHRPDVLAFSSHKTASAAPSPHATIKHKILSNSVLSNFPSS
jgi:pentatricopeptide repeat protein